MGRLWFAPIEGGLFWIKDGDVGKVLLDGLDRDVVYSITGANDELWVGRQHGGFTHLNYDGKHISAHTYTHRDGLAQDSVYTVHRSRDGAIWAGTLSGGVSVLRDGRFTTYSVANGLLSNTVDSVVDSADGTVWFGTTSGLTALSGGRWKTYVTQDGLPSDEISVLYADPAEVLWIGTTKGLAFLDATGVHVPSPALQSLHSASAPSALAPDSGSATASTVAQGSTSLFPPRSPTRLNPCRAQGVFPPFLREV